ncbi:PTS sugar transporter subunit IIB [Clostridium sp. P21]|uniref:PTS sugar transporter subunit IIB n=1 Tax=Clostridium muellerianum TaxID=2716538 RepID=A0A7Y0HNL4_9CLOT|nr:PTS sugar transporter subunit IIB [Clostridium muellerianum]NMM62792.1 PTS sugar transporter subunit IIB [Clostridium muellerianum]
MNILLACSSGMSTSLVVKKMQEAAVIRNIECKIWAVAQDKVEEEMKKADVLLIGPQMRFLKQKFEKMAKEIGINIDIIKPMDYGRCDGNAILDAAIELIKK